MKPSIGRLPNGIDLSFSVENEFFYLNLLKALGVPAANAEMKSFGEVATKQIFKEVAGRADAALENIPQSLPPEFPAPVAESISNGLSARLRLLLPG